MIPPQAVRPAGSDRGPAYLAGFVPDALTGILVIDKGFSELAGSTTKWRAYRFVPATIS